MATTVPMLAPDGSSGDIPIDKVQDAMKSGFKRAAEMVSPDGKKGYIPIERVRDAQLAGFKPSTALPQPEPEVNSPGYLERLTNPVGSGAHEQGLLGGALQVGGQAIKAMAQPFVHPLDTLAGAANVAGAAFSGNPAQAAAIIQPIAEQYAHDKAQGGHALALENLAGQTAGSIESGRMLSAAIPKVTGAASDSAQGAKQYIRPTPSPSIVPRTEMAARNLASSILPDTKDAANYIKAAQEEVPNVIEYAKQTDNPLNTQLEFSKAAQGYAKQVLDLKAQIEGPVQNKLVKTSGTGLGNQMGEGPDTYATISEIDKRITNINDQLRAPKLNSQDARAALASETGLQNEVAGLRKILHNELADASGLTPEQIADIRQRAGRAFELANDTDAAVTKRMQEAGRADLSPLKMTELPSRALNFARGSRVNIADRAFQRAISNFPGQSEPLPAIAPKAMPTAPVDRLEQLLAIARQKQEAARNAVQ